MNVRKEILKGKTPAEQLEFKAHWALTDLSKYYEQIKDNRTYQTNVLIIELEKLMGK